MIDFLELHELREVSEFTYVCHLLVDGVETEVHFDTSILVPALREGDPVVQEMLEESDAVNMHIAAFIDSETDRLEKLKKQAKQELDNFVLYYSNVSKATLCKTLGVPAVDTKVPTITFLKAAAENIGQVYGIKETKGRYDHTDKLIFDGKLYQELLEKQELVSSNLRKLKSLLDQRKSLISNVRSLNTNFRERTLKNNL
jgi:hypothetical protein